MPAEYKIPDVRPRTISEDERHWSYYGFGIQALFMLLGLGGFMFIAVLLWSCGFGSYCPWPSIAHATPSLAKLSLASSFALFGALIGYRQCRTAERKLAFDLYERRWAFYLKVQTTVEDLCLNMGKEDFNVKLRDTWIVMKAEATFLFDAEIPDLIDALFNTENFRVYSTHVLKLRKDLSKEEWMATLQQQHEGLNHINDLRKSVYKYFEPYMSFGKFFVHS